MDDYVLYKNIRSLDLHGCDRFDAEIKIKDFIYESYKMGLEYISIIHGYGSGVIKNKTFEVLRVNKYVLDYKIDIFNGGCTIVKLKR